jgi:hypothetical protein
MMASQALQQLAMTAITSAMVRNSPDVLRLEKKVQGPGVCARGQPNQAAL